MANETWQEQKEEHLKTLQTKLDAVNENLINSFKSFKEEEKKKLWNGFYKKTSSRLVEMFLISAPISFLYGLVEDSEIFKKYFDEDYENMGNLGAMIMSSLTLTFLLATKKFHNNIELNKKTQFKYAQEFKRLDDQSKNLQEKILTIKNEIKPSQKTTDEEAENQETVEQKPTWPTISKEDYKEKVAIKYFSEQTPASKTLHSDYESQSPIKSLHRILKTNTSFDDFEKNIQSILTTPISALAKTLFQEQNSYHYTKDFLRTTVPMLENIRDNLSENIRDNLSFNTFDNALKDKCNETKTVQKSEPTQQPYHL